MSMTGPDRALAPDVEFSRALSARIVLLCFAERFMTMPCAQIPNPLRRSAQSSTQAALGY
jgi:hypothetical protein